MTAPARDVQSALTAAFRDLENRARSEERRKRFHRRLYEGLNILIGLPAAVLAGAATITALEDVQSGLVAALAGGATVLSTVLLFLRPAQHAAYNRALEAELGLLANHARRLREIELLLHDGDDVWAEQAAAKLEKYDERFAKLCQRMVLEE
jgi:hypothetical protein